MAAYRVSYYLYRSNPIILREIKVPLECTIMELTVAFALALGVQAVPGTMWDNTDQILPEDGKLCDFFCTGEYSEKITAGKATLYQDEKRQDITSLTVYFEVLEETDEEILFPDILKGVGYHLPQNIFRIGIINEILTSLEKQESYTMSGMGTFYRGQQEFNMKKTHNMLCSYFAPNLVSTLRTEYAVPLSTVLENKTVYELKALAERHHVYVYNTRKADYVVALNSKLLETDPDYILREMDIVEYLKFRELAVNGKTTCRNSDDLYEEFPVLSSYGMISISKKQGIFLASSLLQEYEEWFDQKKEIDFRMGKRLASVMRGCGLYYGVFTKKLCRTILDAMYPGEVSDEILDQFWQEKTIETGTSRILFTKNPETGERVAYEDGLFHAKELPFYAEVLSTDQTERYIPDKGTFEFMSQNGLETILPDYGKLFIFVRPYAYGDRERKELCQSVFNCIRKGYPVSDTCKKLIERFHYVWRLREDLQQELEEIIGPMVSKIPDMLYYGYSATEAKELGISSGLRRKLNELITEAMETEKRIKAEKAKQKRAATMEKKKTARNSGTTGRGGTRR